MLTVQQVAAIGHDRRPRFNVPWRTALMQWAGMYTAAAVGESLVEPCMLAAIVSRESGGRNIFQVGIPAGEGCGVGLCQITANVSWSNLAQPTYHGFQLLDPLSNLTVAARYFLEPCLEQFPDSHVAAFAAYNLGGGGVQRELDEHMDPDTYTTGHDYGHAVFTDWINFTAASIGENVDWASYTP